MTMEPAARCTPGRRPHAGVLISPSILNADLGDLKGTLACIATADTAHIDVMDGHFVPNLTLGAPVVQWIQRYTTIPLDVHLMIEDPDRWAPAYAELGAWSVTFHMEAATSPLSVARTLRSLGARAGVALKPATPVETVIDLLEYFDQVLVMTVEPGFGGQQYIEAGTTRKLERLRERASEQGLDDLVLQVDGGVTRHTAAIAVSAGADSLVAGSSVFRSADPAAAIAGLREVAESVG